MSHLVEFVGRLHPMLVHLPIGILLLAILLLVLSQAKKLEVSRGVLTLTLAIGAFVAILSCITGYLLSQTGDYNEQTRLQHQWMGIALAVISTITWVLHYKRKLQGRIVYGFAITLFILLTVAGHLGASLTHGSSYLQQPLIAMTQATTELDMAKINPAETKFYAGVIQPVLDAKCISCHGEDKQKGKLRLDKPEFILKGGKSGSTVLAGKPDDSELIHRIDLAADHEDHMPPKEKPQLTEQEAQLLKLWIETGADFEINISALATEAQVKALLQHTPEKQSDIPEEEPGTPDWKLIASLNESGVSVTPVAADSYFLSVNLVSVPHEATARLKELLPLAKNIIWLKLTACELSEEALAPLKEFTNLTRLSLDDTNVADNEVQQLANLRMLTYLNLKGTKVTAQGVTALADLPSLRQLYLFETGVTGADHEALRKKFPATRIDFGNYQVPTLESDTTQLKQARY